MMRVKRTFMETVPDIFDRLGGTSRVATVLGVKRSAASEMKRRRFIPLKYWASLLDQPECRDAKLSESKLIRIHVAVQSDRDAQAERRRKQREREAKRAAR